MGEALTPRQRIDALTRIFGYSATNGWLSKSQFDDARSHRFSLVQARDYMSVEGVFSWMRLSNDGKNDITAPLVYVACAENPDEAQEIHRKVWSQGLAPFLVIAGADGFLDFHAFRYNSQTWRQDLRFTPWPDSDGAGSVPDALIHLTAIKLRGSLSWREHALDVSGRVDLRLLDALENLSETLIKGTATCGALAYRAANGLIGKMLYVQFLIDRGIVDQKWLDKRGHAAIDLSRGASWSSNSFWKLLSDLDGIFNGSIFPISASDRSSITFAHITLVKSVMKEGAVPFSDGAVQLSFFDIDLGVLRVETLAAVYEQFLKNADEKELRRSGVYYTPPFLVDVVLDGIEETKILEDGVRILDPAAGSGVFLVGAYRRMLERSLLKGPLSLERIRGVLIRNIFGVERNLDACHVTAFSLYLTMLDYSNPRELSIVSAGKDPKKLFPPLLGSNIFDRDFFDRKLSLAPMACIVGNPPWQKVSELRSPAAVEWRNTNKMSSPIGQDQAAELFVWKALRIHLKPDGVMAMLIPAKSFVNPTSVRFRRLLTDEYSVLGAINLAHMRHRLFAGAKHACAAIFLANTPPKRDSLTWIYSPLSISQPVASTDDWPWTLVVDRSSLETFRQSSLREGPHAWFDAMMLRPVDRQIHSFIDDRCQEGGLATLGTLCKNTGAMIRRGGNADETGIAKKYFYAPSTPEPSSGTRSLFDDVNEVADNTDLLPTTVWKRCKPGYRARFRGNFILVPRNFSGVRFVPHSMAYSSSFLGIFFETTNATSTDVNDKFLQAIAKFLNSKVAMYFMATIGRRWLMDRRNVEPNDLADLPCPISGPSDPQIDDILRLENGALEEYLYKGLSLSPSFRRAIEEFNEFRLGFKDGKVPTDALRSPIRGELATYVSTLLDQLDRLAGRTGSFQMDQQQFPADGVGIVVAHYDTGKPGKAKNQGMCDQARDAYVLASTNSFETSLAMPIMSATTVAIAKPLEYFRWTVESAYTDSRKILSAFLTPSSRREGEPVSRPEDHIN